MTPRADFAAAHRRHWNDAELLFGHPRLGNSDHPYGFRAGCGTKGVMLEEDDLAEALGVDLKSLGDEIDAFS